MAKSGLGPAQGREKVPLDGGTWVPCTPFPFELELSNLAGPGITVAGEWPLPIYG